MNKKFLTPISIKIVNILEKEGIEDNDILTVLKNIYNNIASATNHVVEIEDQYYNLLKDTVWYNLEKGTEKTLSNYGSKYITFMNAFNESNIIKNEDLDSFLKNLKDIKTKLTDYSILASLSGSEELFKPETSVYFIGQKGKKKKNSVICTAKNSLGSCEMEKIKLMGILDSLIDNATKAQATGGYIEANFI
jgi:hypothetical protein